MNAPLRYTLYLLTLFLSFFFLEVEGGDWEVYASDPPKKTIQRQAVRKRRTPPPSIESEISNNLPSSRGEGLKFEDTKGLGSAGRPVDAVLILDSSRSMKRNDPDRIRDQGARLFLQFLEEEDRFSIVEFGENASVLTPLTYIKNSKANDIKATLDGIQNEGNFTDYLFPMENALELLEADKRPGAERVIIFLTDGQMDPDPRVGSKEERTKKLNEALLPALVNQNIKLYTLALSNEADPVMLKSMSSKTNGASWHARDVNEIHRIFSDLFLSIKKPQVLELTKDGFEIDGSTHEATFFVNRIKKDDTVVVIDPVGKQYLNKDFPSNWKWFKGEFFDVITVPQPLPGTWQVTGGSTGFAKLLSDLKLEYSWPGNTFDVGDSVILKARLTESGAVINSPELKDLIFYNYKVLNVSKGSIYAQGKLTEIEDGAFQTAINLNEEGEFRLYLSVTSPTFTRQAHVPFNVSTGLIRLSHIPANEFTLAKDSYEVVLHASTDKLKNLNVAIMSSLEEGEVEPYFISLKDYKIKERSYMVPLHRLKAGKNVVNAVVTGVGDDKKKVSAKSETLKIFIPHEGNSFQDSEAEVADIESMDLSENPSEKIEEKSSFDLIWGGLSLLLSLIASLVSGKIFIKMAQKENSNIEALRSPYIPPKDLIEQIQVLSQKSSEKKRSVNETELEIYSELPKLDEIVSRYSDEGNVEQNVSGEIDDSVDETDASEDTPLDIESDDSESQVEGENVEDFENENVDEADVSSDSDTESSEEEVGV